MDGLLITSATKSAGINTCLKYCLRISDSDLGSVVPRPGAGPCGGMDVATEPPRMDSRRVPTLDAAPRRRPTPRTDQSCERHLPVLRECFGLPRALARVPAWDTPQVRPCRLWRGIHAAQGPTPARAQAPPVVVGCGKKYRAPAELHILRNVTIPDDMAAVGTQPRMPIPNAQSRRRPRQQLMRDELDRRPTARNAPPHPDAGAGPDRRPRPGAASTSGAPTARWWPAGRDAVPAAAPLPAAPR